MTMSSSSSNVLSISFNITNRGHDKLIEALKGLTDLVTVKTWKEYVEDKRAIMENEDKKEKELKTNGKPQRGYKGKKLPSPDKPSSPPKPKPKEEERPIIQPQPQTQPQGYQMQYANPQPQMYPYFVPTSTPQGYSFSYYYGSYPPRPPQY